MTRAREESLFIQEELNVFGFIFAPDFDTSQQISINSLFKKIRENKNKVFKRNSNHDDFSIVSYVIGVKSEEEADVVLKHHSDRLNVYLEGAKRRTHSDILKPKRRFSLSSTFRTNNIELKFNNSETFICEIPYEGVLILTLNPYVSIYVSDELEKDPTYNEGHGYHIKHKKKLNLYLENISLRQKILYTEICRNFERFECNANENGLISGIASATLGDHYIFVGGSKEDYNVCKEQDIFPYKIDSNNKIRRFTDEEIKGIILERDELKRKIEQAKYRMNILVPILKEKGLTWTNLGCKRYQFEIKNGIEEYTTWLNSDNKSSGGWCSEQDFIDWINMEGKIPLPEIQVRYWVDKLEKLTENKNKHICYKLIRIEEVLSKKELSKKYWGCRNEYAPKKALLKTNHGNLYFSLEKIKELVEKIEPQNKFTKEDFNSLVLQNE